MKKFLILIFAILLASCTHQDRQSDAVIQISIPDALDNVKDFTLSDLIKDVELLELEPSTDRYISQPLIPHFGKKYILIIDVDTRRIFLFHRDGRFACEIGRKGKGPGEHEYSIVCDMDPKEERIVVSDMNASKVMVFNSKGELEVEKNLSSYFEHSLIQKISWDLQEGISFLPDRPYKPKADYASVVIFDKDLNLVSKVLTRANNDSVDLYNISYHESFSDGSQAFFWECYFDTVYQYDATGKAEACYVMELGKNKLPFKIMKGSDFREIYRYDQLAGMNWIGDYLYLILLLGGDGPVSRCDLLYDTKTQEAFTFDHSELCKKAGKPADSRAAVLQNDLFGLEPVALYNYFPKEKICVQTLPIDLTAHFYNTDCIRNLEVKYPDIRDRLIQAVEDPREDDGTFLIIMHVK